jgi:hypothetical protein
MAPSSSSVSDTLKDLWALLKAYGKQETVDPLKALGRYLGYGVSGAILLSLGFFFLALSALRALQTQTGDVFADTWSFVPYFIVFVALVIVVVVAVSRVNKGLHATYLSETGVPTATDPDPTHHSTPVTEPRPVDQLPTNPLPVEPPPGEKDQP